MEVAAANWPYKIQNIHVKANWTEYGKSHKLFHSIICDKEMIFEIIVVFRKGMLLNDCNGTRTHNRLVCKRTLNHFSKLAK